jgi:GTP pyrophosphokinase
MLTELQLGEGKASAGSIVIRGSEGMAVQFAKCCNPIPGDPITGFIKKGQGLVVHTHDCPTAAKSRGDPEKWLDVEWAPETDKMFDVAIRVTVVNQRGVLAKVAAAIAEAGSNIDNVSMDEERNLYTTMHFTLQVANRLHLAKVMRALRRIQDVVRIARVKD